MRHIPQPQEIYRHFKGNYYQIITMAQHSETGGQLVIYQALYGNYQVYARPLEQFLEPVDSVKYPQADQKFRFEWMSDKGPGQTRIKGSDQRGEDGMLDQAAGEQAFGRDAHGMPDRVSEPQKAMEQTGGQGSQGLSGESGDSGESGLDPLLLEFLDADTYEMRLKILTAVHHRITHEMITTMSVACDIEVEDGDLEERYESLRRCLLTLEKYECNRLR